MKLLGRIFLFSGVCFAAIVFRPSDAGAENSGLRAKFEKANGDYRDGHYEKAQTAYEELAKEAPSLAQIFYNLGNCYFRQGQMGRAILAYERALERDPRNSDIRSNLGYVRSLSEYKVEDKRSWYLRAEERLVHMFTEREVLLALLASLFLFLSAWVWNVYFRRGVPWGWIRKWLFGMTLVLLALYAAKYVQTHIIRDAIVLTNQAEVRYGPSGNDQIAFHLGEGMKVYVLDRRSDWSRILLWSGDSGWIQNSDLAEVRT